MDEEWVPVWRGAGEAEAAIVAGSLEASGVPAAVRGHTTPYRATTLPLGGTWDVFTPEQAVDQARKILREHGEGHNLILEDTGTGLTANQVATLKFLAAGAAVLVAAGIVVTLLN